ncbi:hypothetical protein KC19_9G176700 [Ceratodon purpureus]|uniref:Uncharacterized protein n=1 Tax=Ceratodon purpureus TaxID=3225 RepID=A0A8T0GWD9_CERPU|nr:hypothetical protein KC19_9G176700 [Ceratodon purpureus]
MNLSRTLFGMSPPHIQPLTPVSEVSEPPESPSPYPYLDGILETREQVEAVSGDDEQEMEEPPPPSVPFFRLFAYADALDWTLMTLGSVAAAVHGAALPLYLYVLGRIINLFGSYQQDINANPGVSLSSSLFHSLADDILEHALYIVYIAAAVLVASWMEVACWLYTGERQTSAIRSKGVQTLLKQDLVYFDNMAGNVPYVSQISNDILSVHSALSEKVGNYIHNMATCVGSVIVGFVSCWQISLLTLATGPFIVAAGVVSNIALTRLAEHVHDTYSEAASIAEQALLYIRTVYAFANETVVKYAYANALQPTLQYGVQISLVQGLGLGFIYGIAVCSCALQLWVGHYLVISGKADGGQIFVALFAIILSGIGLNQSATNFQVFEQGQIAAHRLFAAFVSKPTASSSDVEGEFTLADVQGNIELRNVYFSYPSRPDVPVLSGLYLSLPARKTLALAGSNGSGKSSIIALIERFYDPTLGEVLLDGENIKNLKVEWLRSQIGLVSQEPALFKGSIMENICYGREASIDEIEEAAKIAHAHTFISSLPEGYATQVGDSKLKLSEERKVKIAIARAVLKNPRILLLDEATGTLDMEAAQNVQHALDILMLGRSTIVIAHRLSSIRNADVIAVLDEGQLVEMGTHDELMRLDGAYIDLIRLQETAKQPRRPPPRLFVPPPPQDCISPNFSKPPSPRMVKSPSLKRQNCVRDRPDYLTAADSQPSNLTPPPVQSSRENENGNIEMQSVKSEQSVKRQDSFENAYNESLSHINLQRQTSNSLLPESPVSPLLTDPEDERSHSKTFSRSPSQCKDFQIYEDEPASANIPSLWKLAKLSSPEWFCAILGSLGAILFGSLNPLFAFLLVQIAEVYYDPSQSELRHELSKWCSILVGLALATILANFLQHFYFGIMGEKMTERIRRLMFSAMLRNEVGWYDKEENSPEVLSIRLGHDAAYVKATFSNRLSVFIQDISAVCVAIALALVLEWRFGLVALATIPLLVFASITQQMWNSGFSGDVRDAHKDARQILEEAVANMHTVMSFSGGLKILDLFHNELKTPLRRSLIRGQIYGCLYGAAQFFLFACNALVLYYGSLLVKRQQDSSFPNLLKAFLVFTFTTFVLVEAFGLGPVIMRRRKTIASVFSILDRGLTMPTDEEGLKPPFMAGRIEFRHVGFRYPARPEVPILTNFNLKVEAGQTVAIVGTAGSGKSTVLALLVRFYEPTGGKILLDGNDLRNFNLRWLRSHIGMVPQEPVLFSTSIRNNIIYGRHNATEAEIKEASRIANAHHFISSLPHGYDTIIGEQGIQLTPGQRLRIAIARTVLKNAPLLLIDEPTSLLEAESSKVVNEALDQLIVGNRTTVVVAHRLAMLRRVDIVAMLHDGEVDDQGSHDELMNKCGLYARLMQPQFSRTLRQHRHS